MSEKRDSLGREKLLELKRKENERLEKAKEEYEKVKEQHEKKTQAIDAVLSMLDNNGRAEVIHSVLSMIVGVPSEANYPPTGKKIPITREIRNAIKELEGEFTQQDITTQLKERYPFAEIRPATVSSVLWRMANQEGGIKVMRKGYGSEPNVYQKVVAPGDDAPDGA